MVSASELQYQLLLAHDLKYLKDNDHEELDQGVTEVKQLLTALIKTLKADRCLLIASCKADR